MFKKALFFVLCIDIFFLFTACQSHVGFHIRTDKSVNRDSRQNSSEPVSVQVYQLKDPIKFRELSFFQINDDPEKSLGSDYIPPYSSFIVSPHQEQDFRVNISSGTKYLGIVAAFELIDSAHWKLIVPLEGDHKSNVKLFLKDKTITLE